MIQVDNLSKSYGTKKALDNISFSIKKGEVIGLLGPNGAGKSTTMNILTGYISSSEGTVKIGEYDILKEPIKAKRLIGYLPEQPPLYLDMTVKDYLDFVYDLKKATNPRVDHINQICELVKITDVYNRLIKNLSKGYKQRVGLAQALIGDPDLLILDEPTVGLDPKQIIEIRNVIRKLSEKHTVILSSHILSEVQATCDRIIVVNKGKIVADDRTDKLSDSLISEHKYVVKIDGPVQEVEAVIKGINGVSEVYLQGEKEPNVFEYLIEADEGSDIRRDLFKRIADKHWYILGIKSNELSLEEIFLELTENVGGIKK